MNYIQKHRRDLTYLQDKIKNLKLFIVHAEAELHEMSEQLFDMEDQEFEKEFNKFINS